MGAASVAIVLVTAIICGTVIVVHLINRKN